MLKSWGPVHVIAQILGLMAAIAGVVIAILAFGWKRVPGERLYLPHKWVGVGVMGMALIQVCHERRALSCVCRVCVCVQDSDRQHEPGRIHSLMHSTACTRCCLNDMATLAQQPG